MPWVEQLVAVGHFTQQKENIMAIEASHYGETRKALAADPIIRAMADGVRHMTRPELAHEDGTPLYEFMSRASDEYHNRGGKIQTHIGGPAEAILIVLGEQQESDLAASDAAYITLKENLAREARSLRIPMTHLPKDEEYMPVLSYRVDQEIAAAERRVRELKLFRDRFTA
jgi:hypothetical protein